MLTHYCFVIIHHLGSYIAKFSVNWEVILYDETNSILLTPYHWEGNDIHRTTSYYTIIPIPEYAQNLTLTIQNETDLNSWHTLVHKVDVPLKTTIKIKTWGTATDPQYSIVFQK